MWIVPLSLEAHKYDESGLKFMLKKIRRVDNSQSKNILACWKALFSYENPQIMGEISLFCQERRK